VARNPPSCYEKAVELLGQRPHFRRQLAQKLARRGYPEAEIEQALDRLAEQGYLDDAEAARGFAAGRLAGAGEGNARIAAELRRRGADAGAVSAALADLPADELPAARRAAAQWLARHPERRGGPERRIGPEGGEGTSSSPEAGGRSEAGSGSEGGRDLAPLARHLARKGYPSHVIVAVLNEQPGGGAAAAALEGDEP
jgi:SOS response regulatory protein OraA/RecX